MTTISNNDIARAIYLSLKDKKGVEFSVGLKRVVDFIYRKHLLLKVGSILSSLREIINKEEGVIIVKVSSTQKLEDHSRKSLIHLLKKRYLTKEVNLIEELNEKLLGGIRIEVNDEVIDLTTRNKVIKLQEYLVRE